MTTIAVSLFFLTLAMAGIFVTTAFAAKIVYFAAIDAIEIYTRATTAAIDHQTRREKLEFWREKGQAQIEQNRQIFLTGGDR